ncbi:uncharacterized protein LOC128269710 [Anopheles cruzii]|uniref:uncharacterized protein LOC128269710 n=1 Tax=Anopheles cruzii TaxID=68878 RepID=UPI0022EC6F00|nr:uncharacterized protein LOC128269710 [Anopheles cruzii]
MDVCAGGFGVCCVFQFGCDGRTEQNISYFYASLTSLANLNTVARCSGTVKLHRHVRQVLLEFVLFELLPPQQGNCREDRFFISVQNSNRVYPVLCGINTGQHMYLDIDAAYSQQLSLMAISNTKQASGTLLVKITQFAHPKSPADCLQFHDGLQGVVKSFNYDDYSTIESHTA